MPITPFDRDSPSQKSEVVAITQMRFEEIRRYGFGQIFQSAGLADDVHFADLETLTTLPDLSLSKKK